ncbi:MAG: glycosyltransferase family 4 protein [Gaiellaceae bacterium]
MKRRALFVGRSRYRLPLNASLARKWDALANELDLRVLARGEGWGDDRFRLTLPDNGLLFQLMLPFTTARELRRFRPDALVAQSPHEAAAALVARRLAATRTPIVLEIHGDWRTATRLYGSPLRRLFSALGDAAANWALRRAEVVRALSPFTERIVEEVRGRPADARFPTYSDFSLFVAEPPKPLPERPTALFIGVLEPYKGIDRLDEAWRIVAPRLPQARLRIVGRGPQRALVEALVGDFPGQTLWQEQLGPQEVVEALDDSTLLFLPSRSEGLPRVVMEAFCRGRPVVGSFGGGIPDLVVDGENGLLGRDGRELGEALVRLLGDAELGERLARGAAASEGAWLMTAEELARRTRELVEQAARSGKP